MPFYGGSWDVGLHSIHVGIPPYPLYMGFNHTHTHTHTCNTRTVSTLHVHCIPMHVYTVPTHPTLACTRALAVDSVALFLTQYLQPVRQGRGMHAPSPLMDHWAIHGGHSVPLPCLCVARYSLGRAVSTAHPTYGPAGMWSNAGCALWPLGSARGV